MTTFLAQNQFISNSVAPYPAATDTAAADQVAPQVAAAGTVADATTVTCFDCGYRDPCDEDCPNYIDEPSMTNGGDQEAPAPRCTEQHNGAGVLGCLTAEDEALYWQLRHADNPFTRDLPDVPDPQAFFDAIEPMPLFLQMATA